MQSPAWRTQRSLAIITFDEDGTDYQHPAQRVATIMIGSAGVRQGYVSHVRYTHYSLLRTIEAALGLGTLTANDRYAEPVNDVFLPGQAAPAPSAPGQLPRPLLTATATGAGAPGGSAQAQAAAATGSVSRAGASAGKSAPRQQTAFVVNSASGTVTPVNLVTRHAYAPIRVGSDPQAIAITPDGSTAYVVNSGVGTVTPIATATRRAGPAIRVGADPQAIAIAPDGRTAYVTDAGSDAVTPISLATGHAGPPIPVGADPQAIAITPDGRTALVLELGRLQRDADQPRFRPRGRARSGWAATRSRSRLRRTARPPTSRATARHGHPDQHRDDARRAAGPRRAGTRTRSPSPRTAGRSSRWAATPTRSR